jgi:hypothetical protein
MNTILLLPHRWKAIGWGILIPALVAGIILTIQGYEPEWLTTHVFAFWSDHVLGEPAFFSFIEANVTGTLVGGAVLVGALLVGFSQEKVEDEYIASLRLSSLLWAVWVNYLLLLVAFLFVWGMPFFNVMVYNMFTVLIIFIARFNIMIRRRAQLEGE